jgi:hypothetical protein
MRIPDAKKPRLKLQPGKREMNVWIAIERYTTLKANGDWVCSRSVKEGLRQGTEVKPLFNFPLFQDQARVSPLGLQASVGMISHRLLRSVNLNKHRTTLPRLVQLNSKIAESRDMCYLVPGIPACTRRYPATTLVEVPLSEVIDDFGMHSGVNH